MNDQLATRVNKEISVLDLLAMFGIKPNREHKITSIYSAGEKTPSMHVYAGAAGNHCYCYATQRRASVIDLYMYYANERDFKTALHALAGRFNIQGYQTTGTGKHATTFMEPVKQPERGGALPSGDQEDYTEKIRTELNEYWQEVATERAGLFINEKLNSLSNVDNEDEFIKTLIPFADRHAFRVVTYLIKDRVYSALQKYCGEPQGAALHYLTHERCYTPETLRRFRIFHIADYTGAGKYLNETFDPSELKLSGIVNDKGNLIFYKHTILIPYLRHGAIYDLKARYFYEGSPVPVGSGKYMFPTGSTAKKLYFSSDPEKLKGREVWVFEGEFDCILAAQEGYSSIAIAGAGNIPENIAAQVRGFKLVLLGDRDSAGENAKDKLKTRLQAAGIEYEVRAFPDTVPEHVKDFTDLYKWQNNEGKK